MKRAGIFIVVLSLILAQQIGAGFSTCKFNFGMAWDGNKSYPGEVDYLTIWAGSDEAFNEYWIGDMLRYCKSSGKTPVYYSYIIAFTARRDLGLKDCDVGTPNLCQQGANYIRQNWTRITGQYEKYASNTARILGASTPMIWLMEPDYYQYNSSSQQGGGLSAQELATRMSELVGIIKKHLPNAMISMDISPWVPDQRAWFSSFNMGQFSFMNTSGGRTDANSTRIRNENNTTWKSIHDITGKGIIADDGYGVGGGSIGHDATWDDPANINARIADGVIAITQASPRSDWGSIIASIRPRLNTPLTCSNNPPPTNTSYSLSITTSGSGSVSRSPNQTSYSSGTVVSLTATAGTGYVFSGWSGDLTGTANPASVTMNANKVITANFTLQGTTNPPPSTGGELLVNGNFSSGSTPWNLGVYGGSASGKVVNGEYETSITSAGSQAWNIQFTQGGVSLEKGKTYTLSFKARASSARSVEVNVGMSASPYTSYMGSFNAQMTTTMQTFTKTFTMTANSDANARVEFNSGLQAVRWYVDDISLVEGSGTTPPPTTTTYTLGTSVVGQGSVSRSPNATSYTLGTQVTLTATPAAGYVFSGWSGGATGSVNPLTITMDGNKTVTATFTQQTVSYTLGTTVVGQGTISRSPNATSYTSGTQVTLTATPAAGYVFSGWSGGATGSVNPLTITMDGNKTVTVTFTQQTVSYTLGTTVVGQGTISRSPNATSYASGTQVTLAAAPAVGYVFSGWSGGATGSVNPLTITMNGDKTITATFSQQQTTPVGTELLVNGDFSAGVNPWHLGVYGGSASGKVVNGEYETSIAQAGSQAWNIQFTQTGLKLEKGKTYTLSFKARAASARTVEVNIGMSGSPYTSYMGSFNAQLTTAMQSFTKTFTMAASSDANARMEFNSGLSAVKWYVDDVSIVEGTGEVTPPPSTPTNYTVSTSVVGQGSVSCLPNATSYASGTEVTLTATPAAGYVFSGWSGDASGTANPLTVTVGANVTVTATFVQQVASYTLTAEIVGQGTVTKSPNSATYASGTVVNLTATPASGYVFSGWSGDVSGTSPTVAVTMNGNKSVTAAFTQITSTPAAELVVNGNFSSGTTPWHLGVYGGAASGKVANGEYVISTSAAGSAAWNIQFTQTGIKLEKGKTYTLTFEARSSSARTVEVNVGMANSPWMSYSGAFNVSLTTSMKQFSRTFTMTQNSDLNSRLEFNAGLATPTLYLDNISIVEETANLGKRATNVTLVQSRESLWSVKSEKNAIAITSPAGGTASLELFDVRGRSAGVIFSGTLGAGHQALGTAHVPSGHYIAVVKDGAGNLLMKRSIVISR